MARRSDHSREELSALAIAAAGEIVAAEGLEALTARRVARAATALMAAYLGLMIAGGRIATAHADRWLDDHGIEAEVVLAGPLPANPLARDIVARSGARYRFARCSIEGDGRCRFVAPEVVVAAPDAVVAAALRAESVRGFRNWLRFPDHRYEATADGYRVFLRDLRYRRGDDWHGFGSAQVELDRELRPR